MKKFIIAVFLIIITGTGCLFSQNILWWFDTNDSSYGQSSAGDINRDGYLDVVFGCYRNDSCIYALNGMDGKLLWKFNAATKNAEGCNDVATLIYDIDGDTYPEVFVPSSCNPTTFCFNGIDGSVRWSAPTRGSDSPPTIGDIDGDGQLEIMHGQFWDYLICLDAKTGKRKWEIQVQEKTWIQTAPTLVDIDGDGILDFIVATWCLNKGDTNRIYAFRGYDRKILWKRDLGGVTYHGSSITDVNGDGKPDVIIGDYSGTLHAFDGKTGETIWTYTNPLLYYIGCPPAIGDLDGDGICEIIFSSAFLVTALRLDGTEFWQYQVPKGNPSFRGVALADLNDDKMLDVAFGTSTGQVYVLNGSGGKLIATFDLAAHIGKSFNIDHAPLIADFNKDGILDIFIVGGYTDYPNFSKNYGRAYLMSVGKGSGPNWLMFQNNIHRTNSICKNMTSIYTEQKEQKPLSISPNPAWDNIEINIKGETSLMPVTAKNIKIFNSNGECVILVEIKNDLSALKIDISHLPAGVYCLNIDNYSEMFLVVR